MEVRITFRSEVVIEGNSLDDIYRKWVDMPLYSEEARQSQVGYIEIVSAENTETNENVKDYF